MTESLLHKLFPGRTFNDEEAMALIDYAVEQRPIEWNAAQFMYEHGQSRLAADYLMTLDDPKLRQLGRILPELLRKSETEAAKPQVNNIFQKEVTCNGGTIGGNIDTPTYNYPVVKNPSNKDDIRQMLNELAKIITLHSVQWYAIKRFLVEESGVPGKKDEFLRYIAGLGLTIPYPTDEESYRHVPIKHPRLTARVDSWKDLSNPTEAEKSQISVVQCLYDLIAHQ